MIEIRDRIERRSIDRLVPYARNSRTHSDEQIEQLVASMRQWGWTNPVLVDENGVIIAGHGRVLAAQRLGLLEVPVIVAAGWTEDQKRAYVIADNKLALNAGWDEAMLRAELEALRVSDYDLDLLGFGNDELAALFEPEPSGGPDPDEAPPLPDVAVSALGDVWVLGPHRVACGDATSIDAWDALMRGELADCVWTDPPYNVNYESRLAGKIANDSLGDGEFLELLRGAFACLSAVMKPGASIYVAHSDSEPGYAFRRAFRESGFKLSGCLIWKKNQLVLGRSDYQSIHEPILYGWKPGSRHRWFGGRKQVTVQEMGDGSPFVRQEDGSWAIRVGDQTLVVAGDARVLGAQPTSVIFHEKPQRSAEHPTMKPVGLIERMLVFSARPGDLIVDAFGGSGSTLMAAERLGMCGRLMELEPRFVDVVVRRWQEYSGRQAVLERTSRTFDEEASARG